LILRPGVSRRTVAFVVVVVLLAAGFVAWGALQRPAGTITFNFNVHMYVNGLNVNGWTVSSCPASLANGTWVCSLILNGVVENSTLTFRSGQKVLVNLWFEYLKKPADPNTITLRSVSAGTGFQIDNVAEKLPFNMTGWGDQEGLVVLLQVLPGARAGSIDMSVEFGA